MSMKLGGEPEMGGGAAVGRSEAWAEEGAATFDSNESFRRVDRNYVAHEEEGMVIRIILVCSRNQFFSTSPFLSVANVRFESLVAIHCRLL